MGYRWRVIGLSGASLDLAKRILAFELDEVDAALPFTSRLAREQGWSHVYAGRVVMEYKRFLVLAMVAGHPVTPSVAVDQVWHLHLIYTRNYWHDLCRDVLGRDLHHGPTKGGVTEGEKFVDWYERTLNSYRKVHAEEPPPDIWPDSAERFGVASSGRWVNPHDFWLIPKPKFMR